MANKDAV